MTTLYDPERIRGRLGAFRIRRMFRVIHQKHRHHPLGAGPTPSRFSDPAGAYAVLYASEAVRCSFWEALARNRFARRNRREMPRADVAARLVVALCSTDNLALVDLRGDGPIRIAAPAAVTHDSNHVAGRALSAATYVSVPEADGFLFHSRFTGHVCVAVFDRAVGKLKSLSVSRLIEHADFLDALDDYEITLIDLI